MKCCYFFRYYFQKTLQVSGRLVYDIESLTTGTVYYVRVSAYNGVTWEHSNGYGEPR